MAFTFGPSPVDLLAPGLSPRAAYPAYHLSPRQSNSTTGTNNTLNMFISSNSDEYEYAASIVSAYVDATVFAMQCTAGPTASPVVIGGQAAATCGPSAATFILTSGASIYEFSTAVTVETMGYEVTGLVQETCVQSGTTAAACTETVQATVDNTKTTTTTTATLSGTDYHHFNVAITGGAEKTASPTGKVPTNAAARPMAKKMAIWGLVGVVAAGIQTVL
ncbi:hypothetical protein LSUE1_G007855 [Lachnellula suecica]|uniref:Uncharacterized protein n=1 Tax=Lachnellula suecica TaxID=602035 RepID=A0A8T9C2G5_9HELO|nr:hypothetical protein LSUE1_G007855 [Lachnellula suecica]